MHAAGSEMPARDLRVFGGDANMAPARGIVLARKLGGLRHGKAAAPDLEVDRRIDFRIVELHQHVAADDAQRGSAEGNERRHIEAAHADDLEIAAVGAKAQLAVIGIGEGGLRPDAGTGQERQHFAQNAPFRQGQDRRLARRILRLAAAPHAGPPPGPSSVCSGCQRVGQDSPTSSR